MYRDVKNGRTRIITIVKKTSGDMAVRLCCILVVIDCAFSLVVVVVVLLPFLVSFEGTPGVRSSASFAFFLKENGFMYTSVR